MVQQLVNVANDIPSVNLELTRQTEDASKTHKDTLRSSTWNYLVVNWPVASQPIALLTISAVIWTLGKILLPEYSTINATPVRMAILFFGGQFCGVIFKLLKLPEMLGMLGFGVFFANMGWANFDGYNQLETILRELALVNIMLLAGIGIDLKALIQNVGPVLRLTIMPTIAEVVVSAAIAKWALGMTWMWGTLLGLVITAVSPNVVIDIVIWLREEKLGLYKGIHTIIIAVTTCNDVLSIFFFNVVLGMIFSKGPLIGQLLQGPIGIAIGIAYGLVYGLVVGKILPSHKSKYANGIRFTLMVLGGMLSVQGSKAIGFTSAGALGCIIIACVCGRFWQATHHMENIDIPDKLNLLWKFVKPISFALIGKEVVFAKLDGIIVGYGILLIVVGSILRLFVAYLSAYGAELDWKERLYVTISGFPKATVQAALGPVALDLVRQQNMSEYYDLANTVLIVSVIAIVLTAPLGAIFMVELAPKFLHRNQMSPP